MLFCERKYEKNNAEGFTMDVFAFCSPKLDRETIQELKSKYTGKPNTNVEVNMVFIQNDRDIVTKSGSSNVPNIGPFACTYFLNKRRYAYVNPQAHSESILDTATFERPKIRKDSMETLIMGMADTSVGSNSKQMWQKTECHHYARNALERGAKQDKLEKGSKPINIIYSFARTNFSDVLPGNGSKRLNNRKQMWQKTEKGPKQDKLEKGSKRINIIHSFIRANFSDVLPVNGSERLNDGVYAFSQGW